MTLDGKSFALGAAFAIVFAAAAAFYADGKIREARELERAASAQQLATMTAERDRLLGVSQQLFARVNQLTVQRNSVPTNPVPQDPAVDVLNALHPGLGTAAGLLNKAVQADQAKRAAASQSAVLASRPPVVWCPSGDCVACDPGYALVLDRSTQKHVCALDGN